jgi:hypothetical protein
MKFLLPGLRFPATSARAKRVGELPDRENTLAAELLTFTRAIELIPEDRPSPGGWRAPLP